MSFNHNALYDSISIAHKLDDYLDAFKFEEIQLFSYFSSILFVYEGNTSDQWSYRYIVNKGYPYSSQLQEALDRDLNNGWFERSSDFYRVSARGIDELNKFKKLDAFKPREKYLEAACTTSILMPYKETIRALSSDANLAKASVINNNQWMEYALVSSKFKEISEQLGVPSGDLTIPSLSWLQHLLNESEDRQ